MSETEKHMYCHRGAVISILIIRVIHIRTNPLVFRSTNTLFIGHLKEDSVRVLKPMQIVFDYYCLVTFLVKKEDEHLCKYICS